MAKQLLFDDRARIKLQRGVKILADAVAVTMGPTGRNVIIDKSFGNPLVTKDGVTVSKEVELEDPFEHMGAKLVNEVASKTSDIAGDGTTTATVLARAIYDEGLRSITLGSNPMVVRRGIEKAVEAAIAHIQKASKPVELQGGDCPGGLDLGQQRSVRRQPDRRSDGAGRPRRRDHGRGRQREARRRSSSPRGCSSTRATSLPTSSPTRRT